MTQNFADLGKRGASFEHANGQRVAELMGTGVRCVDLGSLERVTHDRADGV
jgi:hypothetical protein